MSYSIIKTSIKKSMAQQWASAPQYQGFTITLKAHVNEWSARRT